MHQMIGLSSSLDTGRKSLREGHKQTAEKDTRILDMGGILRQHSSQVQVEMLSIQSTMLGNVWYQIMIITCFRFPR
jgi:hypothetical protein